MFAHSLATQPGVPEERNIIVGCGREREGERMCECMGERERVCVCVCVCVGVGVCGCERMCQRGSVGVWERVWAW